MPELNNPEKLNIRPENESFENSADSSFDKARKVEQRNEAFSENTLENQAPSPAVAIPSTGADTTSLESKSNDITLSRVESILAEGLDNIFLSMDAGQQRQFKIKGEETSQKIALLLQKAKIKAQEISNLIVQWLRLVPRINKHFVEQEAKIKTDKIIKLHRQK